MTGRILGYSAVKSAVHDMHIDALAQYAGEQRIEVLRASGIRNVLGVLSRMNRGEALYVQATGIFNLVVLPLARLRGLRVVYYLHEPTSLIWKIKKSKPHNVLRRIGWHLVQFFDCRFASHILVSRSALATKARECFFVPSKRLVIAPLLMPSEVDSDGLNRKRITYLGRVDEKRYFREFLSYSNVFRGLGFEPTVLTGTPSRLSSYNIPTECEVIAERHFPEELKKQVIGETAVLWNPKRAEIAQSGVTADSVRFGVPILLTDYDPSYELLVGEGIAIDFDESESLGFRNLLGIDQSDVVTKSSQLFSREHGAEAFRSHYQPVFN